MDWFYPYAMAFLDSQGIETENALITVEDRKPRRMRRKGKKFDEGASLPEVDLENMVEHLANPDAIVWDKKKGTLLYVFTPEVPNRKGKFVIRVDYVGGKQRRSNAVQSGGVVQTKNLIGKDYLLVFGEI